MPSHASVSKYYADKTYANLWFILLQVTKGFRFQKNKTVRFISGEGDRGAGGVQETGEERAGGGISTMAGSGREIQKGSQRNEPNNVSSLPFNVFRGLKQNLYVRKVKKRKFVLGPVKSEKKQHYFL